MSDFEIRVKDGKAEIYTPFNRQFVDKVKLMGARWNGSARCWTMDADAVEDVRKVMRDVYGRDDGSAGETVTVTLEFAYGYDSDYGEPVTILGRTIATAFGRDSGARVGDGVMFLEGKPTSAGSRKNWYVSIPSGSIVKLLKVPKTLIEAADLPDGVTMAVTDDSIDRAALESEKAKLMARIAEIDALLA